MKNNKLSILLKGLIKENPVLVLVLGTCPTLAQTTSVMNALYMGIAATIVLVCSNVVISALRKIIPDTVRIPCYIVIIATFVTIVQLLRLNLERGRLEMAAISSHHLKTRFLIDNHFPLCGQILKVDRTFPIHVEIRLHLAPSAQNAIRAIHITTDFVIIEIAPISRYCHYRQIIVFVLAYICACNHTAWKFVVREHSQTQHRCL